MAVLSLSGGVLAFQPAGERALPPSARESYVSAQSRVMVGFAEENFVAVWSDDVDAGITPALFGIRFDGTGALLDSSARPLVRDGQQHAIAYGDGRWLVSAVASDTSVYAHLFDASLWARLARIDVTPSGAGGEQFTYAAFSPLLHTFAIAWRDGSSSYAAMLGSDGGLSSTIVIGPDSLSGRPIAGTESVFLLARTAPGAGGGSPTLKGFAPDGAVSVDAPIVFNGRDSTSIGFAARELEAVLLVSEASTTPGFDVRAMGLRGTPVDGGVLLGHHTVGRLSLWLTSISPTRFFATYLDDTARSGDLMGAYLDPTGAPVATPSTALGAVTGAIEPSAACAPSGVCAVGYATGSRAFVSMMSPDGGLVSRVRLGVRARQQVGAVSGRSLGPAVVWREASPSAVGCAIVAGGPDVALVLDPSAPCGPRPALIATDVGYLATWVNNAAAVCVQVVQPPPLPAAVCTGTGRRNPTLAWDPLNRRALLAWLEPLEVHGRWLDGDGTPRSPEFRIAGTGGNASPPVLAAGAGVMAVVWGEGAGPPYSIAASTLPADGGVTTVRNLDRASSPLLELAAAHVDGGFVVVWRERAVTDAPLLANFVGDDGEQQLDAGLALGISAAGPPSLARVGPELLLGWVAAPPLAELNLSTLELRSTGPEVVRTASYAGTPAREQQLVLGESLDGHGFGLYERDDGFSTSLYVVSLLPDDAGVEPVDAGTRVDAGTPDDAGTPSDAGSSSDAGQPDGGSSTDGGVTADGGVAPGPRGLVVACGCTSVEGLFACLALLWLVRRRQ